MTLRMTLPGLIRPASVAGDSKHDGDSICKRQFPVKKSTSSGNH